MSTQPPAKPRAYRDFLTPLLHRRFTDASLLVLAVCWVEATLISSHSIWTAWIPFGFTGVRTLLLFCPCLAVFIVRLSDLHFGEKTWISDWEILQKEALSLKTVFILLWYMYSAMFFGEVYIWSKGQEANLGWVDYGKAYERPRLNENPMVLRCLYQFMAVVMTLRHIRWDIGNVTLRLPQQQEKTELNDNLLAKLPLVVQDLISEAGPIIRSSLNTALAGFVCTILGYHLLFRQPALQFAHFFGTLLYQQLPHKTGFIGIINLGTLLWQAVTSSVMLSFIWIFSNAAFAAYVSRPPLKKDQPLTSEIRDNAGTIVSRSADPNASLITGLKSKKDGPHTFALWELFLICTRYESRRKTIFLEVDRSGGSSWSQISQQCITEISDVASRIDAQQKALAAASQPQTQPGATANQPPSQGLPKIANEQVREDDVLVKGKPDLAKSISNMARSAGSHPQAESPLSPVARKAIAWGKNHVLTPEQQASFTKQGISKETSTRMLDILRTPLGAPFRESFDRTIKAVLFGAPYSHQMSVILAARSLAALLKASLVEDTCGIAAKDVPLTIRTLTSTIVKIRHFVSTTQPSWTDVYFNERQRKVKDVDDLASELQQALEVILLAFSEYASSVGISKKELREAKEAVGMHDRQEMVKI